MHISYRLPAFPLFGADPEELELDEEDWGGGGPGPDFGGTTPELELELPEKIGWRGTSVLELAPGVKVISSNWFCSKLCVLAACNAARSDIPPLRTDHAVWTPWGELGVWLGERWLGGSWLGESWMMM